MAEIALAAPILILLFFGLTYAAFYAFRAAAADWGVFAIGVAEGVYAQSASGQARTSVAWPDIAGGIATTNLGEDQRQVQAAIGVNNIIPWVFGLNLDETQMGSAYFRLWRFYPGPPPGDIE